MKALVRKNQQSRHAAAVVNDPRWKSLASKDAAADGQFYYSVQTTGVYCRPSCAARRPRPENVRFHTSVAAAVRAGFRPCKRCKPDQASLATRHLAAVIRACRVIEEAEQPPALHELAKRVGMSPYHFHRIFKQTTGLTPRGYVTAYRENRLRKILRSNKTITGAIFESGYNTSSRFYETSDDVLGMTPTAYRKGGVDMEIMFAVGLSSLGTVMVAQSHKGICAILIGDTARALKRELKDRFPRAELVSGDDSFADSVSRVVRFIDKPGLGLNLPLDVQGTAFQKRVWNALCQVKIGETASYTEIAERIGAPKSVRAVASACAANALAVAIPCHRILRRDGALSGYRWGVDRKRALLKKETMKQKRQR